MSPPAPRRWRRVLLGAPLPLEAELPGPRRLLVGFGLPLCFFLAVGLYLGLHREQDGLVQAQRELVQANVVPALPAGATIRPLGARFGDLLVLEAVELERSAVRPGEQVRLTSYWRLLRPVPPRWKIFVHLEGNVRLNRDHHPLFGALRLSDLPVGAIVRDPQLLWIDPALGVRDVQVWVGIFDERIVDLRLPLDNPQQVENDGHSRVKAAVLRVQPRR